MRMKNRYLWFIAVFSLLIIVSPFAIVGCGGRSTTLISPSGDVDTDRLDPNFEQLTAQREEERQELLSGYAFYAGTILTLEKQKWVSRYEDGSSGIGDATLTSVEILVYDPETRRCYIVAREMSYLSGHTITVNDPTGAYIGTSNVNGFGEQSEYYGAGMLIKKEPEGASASSKTEWTLNFSVNPVRIDVGNSIIFTNPRPWKEEWVTYTTISDNTRLGVMRIWPPDELAVDMANLVAGVQELSGERNYNPSESGVYEATDRFWTPSGKFSYNFSRMSFEEAMAVIERIKEAARETKTFEEMAQDLPDAWKETAKLADALSTVADASATAGKILNSAEEYASDGSKRYQESVESVISEPSLKENIKRIRDEAGGVQAEQGALVSLDSAILGASGGGGAEQQKLRVSYSEVKLLLAELFASYDNTYGIMLEKLETLQAVAISENNLDEEALNLFRDCISQAKIAAQLDQKAQLLLSDIHSVLYDLLALQGVDTEVKYRELNRLYALWPESIGLSERVAVDLEKGTGLPSGYPENIVPVMENAVVAISEKMSDGFTLTLKTNVSIDEVQSFYQAALKGIADFETINAGGMVVLSGSHSLYEISVVIMPNSLGGPEKTVVQIVLLGSG
ncbi:MAG: hypothetical protein KGZ63_08610 [Clostridiales bacterium]|jgi:hypothetical protein|nr:hypothetical protein [Clostridiales bacterium]